MGTGRSPTTALAPVPPGDHTGAVTTIELRGVSVAHDDVPVLADLDLVEPAGQVTALLGASGSG